MDSSSTSSDSESSCSCFSCCCDHDDMEVVEINPLADELMQTYVELSEACRQDGITAVSSLKKILDGLPDESVQRLLSHESDGTGTAHRGTLLGDAIFHERLEVVRFLASNQHTDLEEKSSPAAVMADLDECTPLVFSCKLRNISATKILLECGADPNHGTGSLLPLVIACLEGCNEVVKVLLEHGADPNSNLNSPGQNIGASLPLYLACLKGDVDMVETLLATLKNDEKNLISSEQQVLCLSLLAFENIDDEETKVSAMSFWKNSLEEFKNLDLQQNATEWELSKRLHSLYLEQSVLVQSDKAHDFRHNCVLSRTHSHFPDFKFCVSSEDIGTKVQPDSDTAIIHRIVIRSCVKVRNQFWARLELTLSHSLKAIYEARMSRENKRLCLLIVLENALELNPEHVLSQCRLIAMVVIKNQLHHDSNSGYLILLLDVVNEAIEAKLQTFSRSTDTPQWLMNAFSSVAVLYVQFIFLILREDLNDQQRSRVTSLVSRYIQLCRKTHALVPTLCIEYETLRYITLLFPTSERRAEWLGDHLPAKAMAMLRSFLRCGGNPNARDAKGDTVMRMILVFKEPNRSNLIEVLMSYGGHVDTVNYSGMSPYGFLCSLTDCRIRPLQCRSLQCRAATAISYFKIPYAHRVPKHLKEFIKLHHTYSVTCDSPRNSCR